MPIQSGPWGYWSEVEEPTLAPPKEEPTHGLMDVAAGALKFDTLPGLLYNYVAEEDYETPEIPFNGAEHVTDEDRKLYPPSAIAKMNTATSLPEYNAIIARYNEEKEYLEAAQQTGTTGFVTQMLVSGVADPTTWIPGGVGWVSKGTRLARATKAGIIAGAGNMAQEAALATRSDVKDANDVLWAGVGGLVIGGGLGYAGAALADANTTLMNKRLMKERQALQDNLDKELAGQLEQQEMDEQLFASQAESDAFHGVDQGGTVGAAKRDAGLYGTKGELREAKEELKEWGISIGAVGTRSKNGHIQDLTRKLFEIAGGKKSGEAQSTTAAILRDRNVAQLSEVHPRFRSAFKLWAEGEDIRLTSREFSMDVQTRFENEVRATLIEQQWGRKRDYGSMSPKSVEAIEAAATAHNKATALQAKMQRASGMAEDLIEQAGYFHRRWSPRAMLSAATKLQDAGFDGKESLNRLLYRGLSKAAGNLGLDTPEEVLDGIARSISTRFLEKARDAGTAAHMDLTADSREFILKSIDKDMDPILRDKIEKFLTMEHVEKTQVGHLKKAALIDMSAEMQMPDGSVMRLSDLLEGSLERNLAAQNRGVAGRAAMAEVGIKSDTDWNQLKNESMKHAIDNYQALGYKSPEEAATIAKKEWSRMELGRQLLIGEPTYEMGGAGVKAAQHMKDMTTLSSLGMMGVTQLAETGRIMAQAGIMNTIRALPALKMMFKSVREGGIPDRMIADLEASLNFRIGKDYDRNPFILRDEYAGRTAAGAEDSMSQAGYMYEKSMHLGKVGLSFLSGHRFIQEAQHLVQMRAMGHKFMQMALNPSDINYKRMADLGLNRKQLRAVINQIRRHTGRHGRDSLHTEKWPPLVREDFLNAMHRANSISIQKQLVGETAHWMHNPLGELLGQFRTFPIVAMEKQSLREGRMLDKETIMTTLYSYALGSALYAARLQASTAGMGKYERDAYLDEKLTPAKVSMGAAQMMGILSVGTDIAAQVNAVFGIGNAFAAPGVAHTDYGFSPMNLIPAMNKVGAIGRSLSSLGRTWDPTKAYEKRDHMNHFRLLPYGNTVFGKYIAEITAPSD